MVKIEQRINTKFPVVLTKTATKPFNLLCEACGENTLSRAHVFEWHNRCSEGREDVDDDKLPAGTVTKNW